MLLGRFEGRVLTVIRDTLSALMASTVESMRPDTTTAYARRLAMRARAPSVSSPNCRRTGRGTRVTSVERRGKTGRKIADRRPGAPHVRMSCTDGKGGWVGSGVEDAVGAKPSHSQQGTPTTGQAWGPPNNNTHHTEVRMPRDPTPRPMTRDDAPLVSSTVVDTPPS